MNPLNAFNHSVEVHSKIVTSPDVFTVQAIKDFDEYLTDVAEGLISEVCDGDLPTEQREASLARIRVLAEIRMNITEVFVRKAFGMGKLRLSTSIH